MGRQVSLGSPNFLNVPYGPTSDRPTSPGRGTIRYNTDVNLLEFYNGDAWLPAGSFQNVTLTGSDTAVAGQQLFCNTSGGAFTVTLPASPAVGDTLRIIDVNGTFQTNNLTLARNGSLIMGDAEDLVIGNPNAAFTITYAGSANGWRILSV